MFIKALVVAAFSLLAAARFDQEGAVESIIAAATGGAPGVSDTLAGASPGVLLAGANACDKLTLADQIVAQLNGSDSAIEAAQALVNAEKNFNPFAQDIPTICSDPTLPTTAVLRGITPKIDPAVGGADVANALAASTLEDPQCATGLSIADLLTRNGFSNFTSQASSGSRRRSRLNQRGAQRIDFPAK